MIKSITQAALVGIGVAIVGISIIMASAAIIISISSDDGTNWCKESTNSIAEYEVCVTTERCIEEFKDNRDLRISCFADILAGKNPFD